MEYENFRKLLKVRHLSIRVVAEAINMSDNGLNFAVQHDTIQSGKLKKLCDFFGITPNEWYGLESGNTYNSSNVANNCQNSMQINGANLVEIEFLREQIRIKDQQIAEILRLANK